MLTEFTTVVRRLAKGRGLDGNQAAREALQTLLAQPRVRIEERVPYDHVVGRFLAAGRLSFTDAVIAQMRWHHDKQVPVTFDQGLLAAAQEGFEA